jgi:glycosyltransferase involved in cell wall biosynthesis
MGSVVPHKGVHMVLAAAAAAGIPVTLDVLGRVYDSDYGAELRRYADAAPNIDLRLHGPYEDDAVGDVLSAVDAVVLASQVPEVYPLAAYEALAYGVPVLAGRLGGLPEAVNDGTNGLTFDASRPEELARLMRRLHGDRELLARLREGAAATKPVPIGVHVDAMRAIYDEAVPWEPTDEGALEELDRLHGRLLAAGFGRTY